MIDRMGFGMMNKEGIGGALEREVHEVKYFRKGGNFFRTLVNLFRKGDNFFGNQVNLFRTQS